MRDVQIPPIQFLVFHHTDIQKQGLSLSFVLLIRKKHHNCVSSTTSTCRVPTAQIQGWEHSRYGRHDHTLTHHTHKPLVYSPRLYLQVFQSPTQNPVYPRRVQVLVLYHTDTLIYIYSVYLSIYHNNKQKFKGNMGNSKQLVDNSKSHTHHHTLKPPVQVFQSPGQPSVSKTCRSLSFRFQSFITPTLMYKFSVYLSIYHNNKQKLKGNTGNSKQLVDNSYWKFVS